MPSCELKVSVKFFGAMDQLQEVFSLGRDWNVFEGIVEIEFIHDDTICGPRKCTTFTGERCVGSCVGVEITNSVIESSSTQWSLGMNYAICLSFY